MKKLICTSEFQFAIHMHERTVSQAYFALHETLHKVQNFEEKKIFCY
jgi:hypothetical protein